MSTRILLLLLAGVTLATGGVQAQATQLPTFRSDRELRQFLQERADERERRRALERPRPPAPTTPVAVSPPPAGGCETATVSITSGAVPGGGAVVHGHVRNSAGGPETGVLLRLDPAGVGGTSAADGSYRLAVPAAGLAAGQEVTITAARVGLETHREALTLVPGDSVTLDLRLCSGVLHLQQLVVSGAAAESRASVTNVQHAGVDEGGIVKVHGNYLVMLRRGRLFTVAIGGGRLSPVAAVNAFGPDGEEPADWYDELLVSGDLVAVIGYSYDRGGTEVSVFRIDRAGRLHYRDTYQLRSDDYYSSRNYASRLIGTRLVMYTPLYLPEDPEELDAALPALRRWRPEAGDGDFRRIVSSTRIYRPGRTPDADEDLTLHTVTSCDLAARRMECDATAVVGPWGRVFYVSPAAVYVWVTASDRRRGPVRSSSMLYRMPLDGSAPRALGVEGSPVDQFSFLESDDGHLNVLVRSDARGEAMWGAERATGDVSLLRVPLERFGDGTGSAPRSAYRALPGPAGGGYAFQNRFVGRHLLYGDGSGWRRPAKDAGAVLYAVRWAGGPVAEIALSHGVDRIEGMGADAVVVGTDGENLHFTGIDLDGRPRIAQRYVSRGASQGELRSHGFFYRHDGRDAGVIGLPIRGPGRPGYEHLFEESASILFLENGGARFRRLGELEARPEGAEDDDACVASCVDWYGNSRPLFLRGRIFALLGYELVEGTVRDGRLRERRRIDYTPREAESSDR